MPADLSVNSDDDSSSYVVKYSNYRRSSVQVTPDEMTTKNLHLSSPYGRKLINVNITPPKRERSFENKIAPASRILLSKTDTSRKKRKLKKKALMNRMKIRLKI